MINKSWLFVVLICLFELLWLYGFNAATQYWHWMMIAAIIILDFAFLAAACKQLPTGTVYAIFAGVGTVGAAVMDVLIFDMSFNIYRVYLLP